MTKEINQDQIDRNAMRSAPELPDRRGRLTGHTTEPLKGTDPNTANKRADENVEKPVKPAEP